MDQAKPFMDMIDAMAEFIDKDGDGAVSLDEIEMVNIYVFKTSELYNISYITHIFREDIV